MDKNVEDFLQVKRLAIAGVSRSDKKFGTAIYTELKSRGFEVYGINPNMDLVAGDKCYPNVAELTGKVDGVVICLPPQKSAQVLRESVAAGIRKIWLQQGAQSAETTKVARELGVTPVEGKCILMYAGEVKSIHGFHKFFARLIGQY
jgi:uncharacterized protein